MNTQVAPADQLLTPAELERRNGLRARKPYLADKLAAISAMEARGEVSPIIRLEKSYLCNFQCTHCSAEFYMDRHLKKVHKIEDPRRQMTLDDVREISRQADELGLGRFVITGGEPLVMKDFDAVVEAIDPDKHYVISDTNGWFLDRKKARHLKDIGVEKVQISIDSFIEAEHDAFRNKPGAWKRAMRALDASQEVGLNIIIQTVMVKGRAKSQEFLDFCKFATERKIGLYVSYAKPTGSCSVHPEYVIDKEEADFIRELEKEYNVFTHMTPSYGSYKGCIAVKGIITITSTCEVTPCPYIDLSFGNLRETSLKEVLTRGMRNRWLGPYRPDCPIGEDLDFMQLHASRTDSAVLLPIPWGQGFSEQDSIDAPVKPSEPANASAEALFDESGRRIPRRLTHPANPVSRGYFTIEQPDVDYAQIFERISRHLGHPAALTRNQFEARAQAIVDGLAAMPAVANMMRGVRVPFFLPKGDHADLGTAIDERYLLAVESAFTEAFPHYTFKNHSPTPLTGRIDIQPGSRHETLLEKMRDTDAVGWYFPCLTEFSVPATIEQMANLPENLLLAGGVDTCAALVGSPSLLDREEGYPNLLWLAAMQTEDENVGYYFEAYGRNLTFNRRPHFGQVSEYWDSGIVVLG